ncbi:MAG: hypothetical protein QW707_08000 [Candidatus Bathyarchaeia archaeon]
MSFLYMRFEGRTTSPWHIGLRRYSDYLYTRGDYLWGRGIRGPVLRQLWRTYCPKSDAHDGVDFYPERDCPKCAMAPECPFWNLRGTADEGEFKDKPRLIITNLYFKRDSVRKDRIALATLSDQYRGVVEEKAPVFIEYICEGAEFEFETILMGDGVKFSDQLISAVEVSLKFLGWGGFCNEGFGRGNILSIKKYGLNSFEYDVIEPFAKRIMDKAGQSKYVMFDISPMLILDKDGGGVYRSVLEEGFRNKLCNCINERYWQFYGKHMHIQDKVESLSGRARTTKIQAWSRKIRDRISFEGIGNEITIQFSQQIDAEEAKALALMRYGIGRYKNQGFGSLKPIL